MQAYVPRTRCWELLVVDRVDEDTVTIVTLIHGARVLRL